MQKRMSVLLAGLFVVFVVASPSLGAIVTYTDRTAWESAVAALGKAVETEDFDGDVTNWTGIDRGDSRGPSGPTIAANPWDFSNVASWTTGDKMTTDQVYVRGRTTAASQLGLNPTSTVDGTNGFNGSVTGGGNSWNEMNVGTETVVQNVMAAGFDVSGASDAWIVRDNNSGTQAGIAGQSFVGFVDDTGALSIGVVRFGTTWSSWTGGAYDNFSYAYQEAPPIPEPITLCLMGAGIPLMLKIRRRRRA